MQRASPLIENALQLATNTLPFRGGGYVNLAVLFIGPDTCELKRLC